MADRVGPQTPPRRLLYGAIMLVVALAALWLLVYVGYAEGRRTYQSFVVDKMAAQGELVRSPVETFVRNGLPLRQFPGFRTIARQVLSSDRSIAAIAAFGRTGRPVFTVRRDRAAATPASVALPPGGRRFVTRRSGAWIRVLLPLHDRFETIGAILVAIPRRAVTDATLPRFLPLALAATALALAFALWATLLRRRLERSRAPWLHISFAGIFVMIGAAVVFTLVSIYSQGIQGKARALAESLRQRLEPIVTYHLKLDDFVGLRQTFLQYRELNPDIQAIGLTQNGIIRVHTDPAEVGKRWTTEPGTHEFAANLGNTKMRVAVSLPADLVWRAVAKNIKNFVALFIATALFAGLFLRLGRSIESRAAAAPAAADAAGSLGVGAIAVLQPVFFLAIFFENLSTSFMPQLLNGSARAAGFGADATSWAFATYFLCFLLVLVPATKFADRRGPRALLWSGALLAAAGSAIFALSNWFPALVVARGLAGFGQGMLLIGAQSYILNHAPTQMRARAVAVIVYGFNGGMIAGTAIGSLLVNYIAEPGVFGLAVATGLLTALFAVTLMPRLPGTAAGEPGAEARFLRVAGRALKSFEFLRVIILVGLPAKATLTGIVAFALPLVLSSLGYPPEDIGQIVMIYPCGVLLASGWIARRIDAVGGARTALVVGAIGAGAAMMAISAVDWTFVPAALRSATAQPIVIGAGVLLLGLAHGLINAPVIAYVAGTDVARRLGPNPVSSFYRVLERVGHVAGPALVGQLLVMTGGGLEAIGWAGATIAVLALVFWIPVAGHRAAAQPAGRSE
jgi:predicted MFS family arabinose efflux permease